MVVYLRGLCEFPVCWLDFGPYPSVCICTVCSCCSVAVKSHGVAAIQEVESTDRRRAKVREREISPVDVQSVKSCS